MKRDSRLILTVLAAFAFIAIPLALAVEDPHSPSNLNFTSSSRFNLANYPSQSLPAEAGNVTEVSIYTRSPTHAWQGYFGNITGDIVLEDALGYTFYDWYDAFPKGEIFASTNQTVIWGSIHCFNYSSSDGTQINLSVENAVYGMNPIDRDSLNETFNDTRHPLIYVGPVTVAQDTCPATYVFQNSTRQDQNFVNLLLTDNTSLVFTGIIEPKSLTSSDKLFGYNNESTSFQLLVAEDGHTTASQAAITTYYFWVELS